MRYGENVLTYEPRFRRETPPVPVARPIHDGTPFLRKAARELRMILCPSARAVGPERPKAL
jgi:hypothetical protein